MSRRFAWLILPLFTAAAAAQPPAPQPPGAPLTAVAFRLLIDRHPGYAAFRDPVVAAELKLTDAQAAALKQVPTDVVLGHQDEIARVDAADRAARAKQSAEAPARAKEMDERVEAVLARHLTPGQRARGRQLALQSAAMAAFRDGAVRAALGLTDAQAAAAEKAAGDLQVELFRLFRAASPDPAGAPAGDAEPRRRDAARKAVADFAKSFTPEQARAWAGLVGPPSDKVAVLGQILPPRDGTVRVTPAAFGTPQTRFWALVAQPSAPTPAGTWRDEFKLTDEAFAALRGELSRATRVDLSGPPGMAVLFQKLGREAETEAAKLLRPDQADRLAQVRRQFMGADALADAAHLKELKFTPEQSAAVEAALAPVDGKYNAALAALAASGDLGVGPAATARFRGEALAHRAAVTAAVRAALTADQKRVADRLFGPAVDLTKVGTLALPAGTGPGVLTGWSPAGAWGRAGDKLKDAGKYADARAAYEESVRLKPGDPEGLNLLAFLLAACPDDGVRDGSRAVGLAETACGKTDRKVYYQLDTLAAAYAEVGRFEDAVKTQERAVALLKTPGSPGTTGPNTTPAAAAAEVADYEGRLALYRAKKPFRESPRRPG